MTTRYSPRHSLSSLLSSESDLAEFQALQDSCAEAQARDIPPPYYVTTPVRRLSEATLAECRAVRRRNALARLSAESSHLSPRELSESAAQDGLTPVTRWQGGNASVSFEPIAQPSPDALARYAERDARGGNGG